MSWDACVHANNITKPFWAEPHLQSDSSKSSSVTLFRHIPLCFLSCPDRTHIVFRCCRYGKPAVLDMMDVDMFETAAMKFDEVQKGLMALLMSKDLLKDNR